MSTHDTSVFDAASRLSIRHPFDSQHHGHAVQFYAEDSFLLEELCRFIGMALGGGDSAIVISTKAHREALEEMLNSRGLDTADAVKRMQYIPLDAAEALSQFMRSGHPDPILFAELMGGYLACAKAGGDGNNPRVVAFGEMVALLWVEGKPAAAIELERLWNDLAKTHSFSLRCAYPMAGFDHQHHDEPFLRICGAHTEVIPAETYTALASEGERLRNIAFLQQKEQAHDALRKTQNELQREISRRIDVERKLRESEHSLRELSGLILRMQDEERRHFGRELHDSVGQYLAVVKMGLESLRRQGRSADDAIGQRLSDCLRLVDKSIVEVRTMSYLLYPPMLEEMGLSTAVPWYLGEFSKRSGIQTALEVADTFGRLPRDVELAIFQVLQESLTNVHRHSGSHTAHVRILIQEGAVHLEVRDNGKGIAPAILEACREAVGTLGVGLRGMNERVRQLRGNLELSSAELGTFVSAAIPCNELSLPTNPPA